MRIHKRGDVVKVCVPTMGNRGLNEQIGEHFGRVPTYTIVNTDTGEAEVLPNTSMHMGGVGYAPEIMAKAGVDVMVCSGLGQRAIGMFEEAGIMVYVGAQGTVKDAVQLWKEGKLQPATDETACRKHAFRGERSGCENHHH